MSSFYDEEEDFDLDEDLDDEEKDITGWDVIDDIADYELVSDDWSE